MRPGEGLELALPAPAAGLRVVAARSTAALEALVPAWAALWRRVPGATPFQHPAWLVPWWRAFAHGALWALAVRRGARLAGVLPLYREGGREGERLLPVGVGVTDLLDPLLEEGVPLGPLLAGLPALTGLTEVEFPALPFWSPLVELEPPPGWRAEGGATGVCPVLNLPDSAGLDTVLPPGQTRNLRHTRQRAERAGAVTVETATPDSAGALLEDLFRLHAARWAARGEPGVLADAAVRRFHRAAAPALARAGLLRLHRLRIGGRVAAVHYGMGDGRRAYYYLGGFDPALAPLGPGVLALGNAIDEALREGAREFHFLRGSEPYKHRWGAMDRPSVTRRFRSEEGER